MKKKILLCFMLVCLLCTGVLSAASAKSKGALQPEDFTFRGVALGDTADVMREKLGEPDFDTDIIVLGESVKCYVYSAELKVCVDPRYDKVVAVLCKDKNYKGREDVTYGSTKAKLMQVYGKYEKLKRDGDIYYYYVNPEDEKQKLMFVMETTNFYVESLLLTSLPLTEEEEADYDLGEFPEEMDGSQEDNIGAGFNDRGQWWTGYRVNDNVTIGIGN